MAAHLMRVIALMLIWGVVLCMLTREFSAPQTAVGHYAVLEKMYGFQYAPPRPIDYQ